jgi:adenosine deaminase CECR1
MSDNPNAKDQEWEQAEGVPSNSDPFIQKYLSGRDALVEQEKKQRSGWCIKHVRNTRL